MATQQTTVADMIGFKSLAFGDANREGFNSIVVETEENITRDLLGDELFNAFEADVDASNPTVGTPIQQKHIDLLNGVTWIDDETFDEDTTFNLEGLKEAYKYFVYYEYLNQSPTVNNFVGKARNVGENATQMDRRDLNVETHNRYNRGVIFYKHLIQFVEFFEDYEAEATTIVESPAGEYTVTISDTKYLKIGDTVTIEGDDFAVASLIDDTAFEFAATAGITFTDLTVKWHPFEDAAAREKGKIFFNGMI